MIVNVLMLAHMDGEIRQVNVPDDEWNDSPSPLDLVFYYGQNDVQPVPDRCSVSMGDVILFNGSPCLVIRNGFKGLTPVI